MSYVRVRPAIHAQAVRPHSPALCEHKRMPADGRLDPFDPAQQNGRFRRKIGIGGCLAAPPLPHHLAYGSVPRRFDRVKLGRARRFGGDRASRNSCCAAPVGPTGVLTFARGPWVSRPPPGSRDEAALSVVRGVRAPTGGYLTPSVVMSRSAYSAATAGDGFATPP